MADREKVIRGLECWLDDDAHCPDDDCPYMKRLVCDQAAILHDAISLLKAQEPRVMTLEELSALPIDTPVFIEENNGECGWNVFYGIDEENDVRFCGFKASAYYYDLEEYGESWRCWTSRPNDEQREAVKWE